MDLTGLSLDNETLLTIIENLQESVFVTDGEGKIILVNSVAVKLLGVSAEDMVGFYVSDMINKGFWKNSAVLEVMKTKEPSITTILCRNGSRNISTSIPIFDEQDNIKLIITNSSGESTLFKLYDIMEKEKRGADRYKRELEYLRYSRKNEIVAESVAMKQCLKKALAVAKTHSSVILTGETGVGKDVVANYIHMNSDRSENSFVDINCAAIPDSLFEAELFGYEKGSFTGASSAGKMGLFEAAEHGTVFLDEIAEIPMPFQAKLLRLLESKELRRVGGTNNIKMNARIICATNRNLKNMINEAKFRSDLYYRLNEFNISIDPLRNRREDILPLAELFLKSYNEKYDTKKYFSERVKCIMGNYSWPGNVREVRNVVSHAYILYDGPEINTVNIFPDEEKTTDISILTENNLDDYIQEKMSLKEFRNKMDSKYIKGILDSLQGNITEAARVLGIHRSHLYRIINKH